MFQNCGLMGFVVVLDFCSGHGSFSNNPKLNSVVGHLLHSSILVPYHGWYALEGIACISWLLIYFFFSASF